MVSELLERPCWIFDMDGTLTYSMHDFDAIRAELGLPQGAPILEALAALPPDEAAPLHVRLEAWERDLAHRAEAADDALGLLEALASRGARCAVLTRNTRPLAQITLRAAGLARFFDDAVVLGRACAAPKPSPDGVLQILARWGAQPDSAVMVGDFMFDVDAGRAAGCATVLIDREGHGRWRDRADVCVGRLDALLGRA